MKLRILVTRALPPKASQTIQTLKDRFEVVWHNEQEPIPRQKLMEQVQGCHGILCMLSEKIDVDLIETAGPNLKVVSTMSVGYEHIDSKSLKEKDIKVGNTPDVLTDAVADLNLSLTLALLRRIVEGNRKVVEGAWEPWSPNWMLGHQLSDKTVGILGMGRIGKATLKRLFGFSPISINYYSRSPVQFSSEYDYIVNSNKLVKVDSFQQLLKTSDILMIACDLNASTANLFNKTSFELMKEGSFLINTSRGKIVNLMDLKEALDQGRLAGAGLDVTDPEPLNHDHPIVQKYGNSKLLITPHIGSATLLTRELMADLAISNLLAGISGDKLKAEV